MIKIRQFLHSQLRLDQSLTNLLILFFKENKEISITKKVEIPIESLKKISIK